MHSPAFDNVGKAMWIEANRLDRLLIEIHDGHAVGREDISWEIALSAGASVNRKRISNSGPTSTGSMPSSKNRNFSGQEMYSSMSRVPACSRVASGKMDSSVSKPSQSSGSRDRRETDVSSVSLVTIVPNSPDWSTSNRR